MTKQSIQDNKAADNLISLYTSMLTQLRSLHQECANLSSALSTASQGQDFHFRSELKTFFSTDNSNVAKQTASLNSSFSALLLVIQDDLRISEDILRFSATSHIRSVESISSRVEKLLQELDPQPAPNPCEVQEQLNHLNTVTTHIQLLEMACSYASDGWDIYNPEHAEYRSARLENFSVPTPLPQADYGTKADVATALRTLSEAVRHLTYSFLRLEALPHGLEYLTPKLPLFVEKLTTYKQTASELKQLLTKPASPEAVKKVRKSLVPVFKRPVPAPIIVEEVSTAEPASQPEVELLEKCLNAPSFPTVVTDIGDMFEDIPVEPEQKKQKQKETRYTGKARPAERLLTTESVRQLFEQDLLKSLTHIERKLFYHLFASSGRVVVINEGWLSCCRAFIEKYFRGADPKNLLNLQLVERDYYSVEDGKAFSYRVSQELLLRVSEMVLADMEAGDDRRYDLIKCKYVKAPLKSKFTIGDREKISNLTRDRILGYDSPNIFHRSRCLKGVQQKRLALNSLKKGTKEYRTAFAKYMGDYHAYRSMVLDGGAVNLTEGMAVYTPAYEAQHSGRISHLKGGFQSASREFTAAAFYNIPDYHNYDMVGAQSRIAEQLMRECGFPSEWLLNYTQDKKAKHIHAQACFSDIYDSKADKCTKGFKDMLHSGLMATRIRKPSEETKKAYTSLWRQKKAWDETRKGTAPVLEAHMSTLFKLYGDPNLAYDAYVRFYNHCKPLLHDLEKFHSWIKDVVKGKATAPAWVKKNAVGRVTVHNKMEMSLNCDGLGNSLVAKVVAHLLQGAEARWMTELIKLAPKYGYVMLQDFHDGALIKGIVPEAAQLEATALSGIEGILEIKPFENPLR